MYRLIFALPYMATVARCKCNIRCEQLVLASVQQQEVSRVTCIICVKGTVEHYYVGSIGCAAGLRVRRAPLTPM